jgi:hypothetical protein
MASIETNERKREEMSTLIIRLRDLGWTNSQIALWMRVTLITVVRWYRAHSMGTNLQRAELARLKSPAEERPRILQLADGHDAEAAKSEDALAKDLEAGADHVAIYRRHRIANLRARAKALRELFR